MVARRITHRHTMCGHETGGSVFDAHLQGALLNLMHRAIISYIRSVKFPEPQETHKFRSAKKHVWPNLTELRNFESEKAI